MPDSASVTLGPKLGGIVYCDIGGNITNSLRALLRSLDALVQASVISMTTATPPGSPSNGDAYIVAVSPTGAWVGQAGSLAVWSTQIATADTNTKVPAWEFHTPKAGWLIYNVANGTFYSFSGSAWTPVLINLNVNGAFSSLGVNVDPSGVTSSLQLNNSGRAAWAGIDVLAASSPTGNQFQVRNNSGTVETSIGPDFTTKFVQYTVAGLPASPGEGAQAYATNGRKVGEGVGAGTGVPVYFSAGSWRVYSTDAAVAA